MDSSLHLVGSTMTTCSHLEWFGWYDKMLIMYGLNFYLI